MPQGRTSPIHRLPRPRRSGWRARLRRSFRSGDAWVVLLFGIVVLGIMLALVRLIVDIDTDAIPLPNRLPRPIRSPGISRPLTPPGAPALAALGAATRP